MKKYYYFAALAAALAVLTGCSANMSGSASGVNESNAAEVRYNETEIAPDDSFPAIAFVTREEPQTLTSPPQMMISYSGGGIATAAAMTLGSSTWDTDGEQVEKSGIDPLGSAKEGLITAAADLDLIGENEPCVILSNGAEISNVQLYPLDGSDPIEVEYTQDGVIRFPADAADGVAAVSLSFEQGSATYYFSVTHSLSGTNEPPLLMVYSGDIGFKMTKGGYTWTVTDGDQSHTMTTDCLTPWEMYEGGYVRPDLTALLGEQMRISLPENAEIGSAVYYTSDGEPISLEYSGGAVTLPAEELSGVCCLTVNMPQGCCDYLFSFATGSEFSTAAYDPTA